MQSNSIDTNRTCEHCSKSFHRKASKKARFCSRVCLSLARSSEQTCLICGRLFRVDMNVVKRGSGKFCSRDCHNAHKRTPAETRFAANVSKTPTATGCILWQGTILSTGYGVITEHRIPVGAHRYAYKLAYGPFDESLCVCHKCDNPPCVNPEHLFLGTDKDNALDKVAKGRSNNPRGERVGGAILKEEQVIQIRNRRASGERLCDLAAEFGITRSNCWSLVHRKSWKHIA